MLLGEAQQQLLPAVLQVADAHRNVSGPLALVRRGGGVLVESKDVGLLAVQLAGHGIAARLGERQGLLHLVESRHLRLQAPEIVATVIGHTPHVLLLEFRQAILGSRQALLVGGDLLAQELRCALLSGALAAEGVLDERIQQILHHLQALVPGEVLERDPVQAVARGHGGAGVVLDSDAFHQRIQESLGLLRSIPAVHDPRLARNLLDVGTAENRLPHDCQIRLDLRIDGQPLQQRPERGLSVDVHACRGLVDVGQCNDITPSQYAHHPCGGQREPAETPGSAHLIEKPEDDLLHAALL